MKALDLLVMLYSDYHLEDLDEDFEEAIEELKVLQSNYEAQEIIIADLKRNVSILDKLLDECTYSLRQEELKVADLKKQLEQKTCEGCEFDKHYPKDKYCIKYSRYYQDYYEPKDEE